MRLAAKRVSKAGARALQDLRLQGDHALRVGLHVLGQRAEAAAQALEHGAADVAHRLHERALVQGRERLRREARVGGIGGEREVHLGRALGQQLAVWRKGADGLAHVRGRVARRQLERSCSAGRAGGPARAPVRMRSK